MILMKLKTWLRKSGMRFRTKSIKTDRVRKEAQQELIDQASSTFNGELNDYLDNVRKQHEQIIDTHNIDTVTKSEWDTTTVDKARAIIQGFNAYLEKDESRQWHFLWSTL